MDTVVVQAHPLIDSYNAALLTRIVAGLDAADAEHRVFRIGEGERPTVADLADVSRLVLVYPTWWGGQPAMLLDWLQAMLAASAFASVTSLEAVSTLGSSRFINTVQGQWGRRYLRTRVLQGCAKGAGFEWHALYKIDRRTTAETKAFLTEMKAHFGAATSPVA